MDAQPMDSEQSSKQEPWQAAAAVKSRKRLGWGLALFVIAMFVLPVVAKYFQWF